MKMRRSVAAHRNSFGNRVHLSNHNHDLNIDIRYQESPLALEAVLRIQIPVTTSNLLLNTKRDAYKKFDNLHAMYAPFIFLNRHILCFQLEFEQNQNNFLRYFCFQRWKCGISIPLPIETYRHCQSTRLVLTHPLSSSRTARQAFIELSN